MKLNIIENNLRMSLLNKLDIDLYRKIYKKIMLNEMDYIKIIFRNQAQVWNTLQNQLKEKCYV